MDILAWLERYDHLAGWTQAAGALAAIAVAIWISHRPLALEEKRRKLARAELLTAIKEASDPAIEWADRLADAISAGDVDRIGTVYRQLQRSAPLIELHSVLDVPLLGWPSPLLFSRAQRLVRSVEWLEELLPRSSSGEIHAHSAAYLGPVEAQVERYRAAKLNFQQSLASAMKG